MAAAPTIAQSLARRTNFRGDQLARLQAGLEVPGEEVLRGDIPGPAGADDVDRPAQGEQGHRQVGRGVGVGQRAADRAAVPDLRISHQRGGVGQQRRLGPHQLRGSQAGVRRRRADHQLVTIDPDAGQVGQPADVDEHRGSGQPQLHHRQQRVAAGQQLRVVAEALEQFQGVRRRVGGDIVERRGDHSPASPRLALAAQAVPSPVPAAPVPAAASTARTML